MRGIATIGVNIDGMSFDGNLNMESSDYLKLSGAPALPAGHAGTIATGTATLTTGHGITTGQRVDVCWETPTPGKRRRA